MKKKCFVCDECSAVSELINDNTVFPYHDGWVYIYSLQFKVDAHREKDRGDVHFCKESCATSFLLKVLTLERTESNRRDNGEED